MMISEKMNRVRVAPGALWFEVRDGIREALETTPTAEIVAMFAREGVHWEVEPTREEVLREVVETWAPSDEGPEPVVVEEFFEVKAR